jgi:hypothetical protein
MHADQWRRDNTEHLCRETVPQRTKEAGVRTIHRTLATPLERATAAIVGADNSVLRHTDDIKGDSRRNTYDRSDTDAGS